jgi:hypothetical protein
MVLAAVPVLGLHIGQSGVATLPGNLPSKQGYLAVQRYFPGQSQDPVEIVSVGGAGTARADLAKLETVLAGDPRFGPGVIQASPDGKIRWYLPRWLDWLPHLQADPTPGTLLR